MNSPSNAGRSFVGEHKLESLSHSLQNATENLNTTVVELGTDAADVSRLALQILQNLRATDEELAKFTERLDDARSEVIALKQENAGLLRTIQALDHENRTLSAQLDDSLGLKNGNFRLRREMEDRASGFREGPRSGEERALTRSRRASMAGERRI